MDGALPMTPVHVVSLHTLRQDKPPNMHALEAVCCGTAFAMSVEEDRFSKHDTL